MSSKITSMVALAVIVGASAAASQSTMPNKEALEARRLDVGDGFEYIGCYADGPSPRIMENAVWGDPDMTTEVCATECAGSTYFGTQYSQECFCGDADTDLDLYQGNNAVCDAPCAGDAGENCGGTWAMSVYKYVPTCSNGIPGIDGGNVNGDVCCSPNCVDPVTGVAACGGAGCHSLPGGQESCCINSILANAPDCSVAGVAPCTIF